MDTAVENCFYVHRPDGTTIKFSPPERGIYRYVLSDLSDINDLWHGAPTDSCHVTTIKDQKSLFSNEEIVRAQQACRFQNIIMCPSSRDLQDIAIPHLAHCPVTRRDVTVADTVYGPNLGSLKGKTVHRKPPSVSPVFDPVPRNIMTNYSRVSLSVDIFFLNGVPFVTTYCRTLKFGTVDTIPNRRVDTIADRIDDVLTLYQSCGFAVPALYADPEFEPLRRRFPFLDTCGADDHVGDMERYIRTVKDRSRSTYRMLPFRYVPRIIIVHLAKTVVFWLNSFPPRNGGMSRIHSPGYIMTGRELNYQRQVRAIFGEYVQAHEKHTNGMEDRSTGAICLGPTGNVNGSHYFMCIKTGTRLTRTQWKSLPMPDEVIFWDTLDNIEEDDEEFDPLDDVSDVDSDDESTAYDSGDDDDDDSPDARGDFPSADLLQEIEDLVFDAQEDDPADDPADPIDAPDAQEPTMIIEDDSSETTGVEDEITGVEDDDESFKSTGVDTDDPYKTTGVDDPEPTGVGEVSQQEWGWIPPLHQTREYRMSCIPLHAYEIYSESAHMMWCLPWRTKNIPQHMQMTANLGSNPQQLQPENADDITVETVDDESVDEQDIDDDAEEMFGEPTPPTESERFGRAAQAAQACTESAQDGSDLPKRQPKPKNALQFYSDLVFATYSQLPRERMMKEMTGGAIDDAIWMVTAQMSAKAGLKRFGKKGADALTKELEQLLYRKVMDGVDPGSLTRAEKRAALQYLMFLKEKRCGKVKGQGCADRRKQRLYKDRSEVSAPVVRQKPCSSPA